MKQITRTWDGIIPGSPEYMALSHEADADAFAAAVVLHNTATLEEVATWVNNN